MKRFALAGNPNSGKTTLFNALTGATEYVGNWPGVTVERKIGTYKKLSEPVEIVDLPGIYSLSPYTPEEVIARNFIIDETPDAVINIVDATNLERNLYLTTQILEMKVPVVIALNVYDEVIKNGDEIDTDQLSKELGVPVVKISAIKETGLKELMETALAESLKGREARTIIDVKKINELIESLEDEFEVKGVSNPLFHAVKLAENDEIEVENHKDLIEIVEKAKEKLDDKTFGNDIEAIIADSRYKFISNKCSVCYKKSSNVEVTAGDHFDQRLTKSDKIDKVLTNKWAGIPIFLAILFVIFHITFSSNFLFFGKFIGFSKEAADATLGIFFTKDGINSPGVILQSALIAFTDWLTELLHQLFEVMGAGSFISGLIVDGIFAGLFSILSFLPQILLLFLFFAILEDSGYMARVAFILDRIFRKFGLSGRAFMPMIMGFGCSVPAMINTRTLADDKERTATIRVIPFFSCGAKLPILVGVAGGIVTLLGWNGADGIVFGIYVFGMCMAIVAALLMRNTSMRGEVPPFIMELPAYHKPSFKALMIHLWDKTKHFVKKAFTVIIASTILIWLLSHLSFKFQYLEDEEITSSMLAYVGRGLLWFFTPLGFGYQANLDGWGFVFVVGAVSGLIAKENVITTFSTLATAINAVNSSIVIDEALGEEVAPVVAMIQATGIHVSGLLAYIAFNLLTIPCFAAVATAKAELPKGQIWKTILFWLGFSYLTAAAIYVCFEWWWTSFIVVALIVGCVFAIHYYNKRHPLDAPKVKEA